MRYVCTDLAGFKFKAFFMVYISFYRFVTDTPKLEIIPAF